MSAFFPSEPALAARRDIALRAMTEKLEHGETDAGLEIFIDYVNGPGAWKSTAEGTKNWLRANAWTLAAEGKDTATWAPFSCEDAKGLNVPGVAPRRGEVSEALWSNTGQNSGMSASQYARCDWQLIAFDAANEPAGFQL